MSPGNTTTGQVMEQLVEPSLRRGGYAVTRQVNIGQRLGCGRHIVDAIATKEERKFLISLKWQQVSGTAEQKVPFEVICLSEAVTAGEYEKAYLVLGGEGWTLRTFFTSGGLSRHLTSSQFVEILTLEAFIAKANSGKL